MLTEDSEVKGEMVLTGEGREDESTSVLPDSDGRSADDAQIHEWFVTGSHPNEYEMSGDPAVPHGSEKVGYVRSTGAVTNDCYGVYGTTILPGH